MTFKDFNQTLVPPAGHEVTYANADGAYLVVEYRRSRAESESVVTVFLNYMGREVARTENIYPVEPPNAEVEVRPVGRWFRFKNAFYLVLAGLEEMSKCLKKS